MRLAAVWLNFRKERTGLERDEGGEDVGGGNRE